MKEGTIKYYSANKDLGLIEPEDMSKDVIFQRRVVEGADTSTLLGGEPIKYEAEESSGGVVIATRVIVLP